MIRIVVPDGLEKADSSFLKQIFLTDGTGIIPARLSRDHFLVAREQKSQQAVVLVLLVTPDQFLILGRSHPIVLLQNTGLPFFL